jgi:hypothetical protein
VIDRAADVVSAARAKIHVRPVHAAAPVNDENDLGGCVVDIGHHLMDDGAHDALLQPRIGRRCGPDGLEVEDLDAPECGAFDDDSGRFNACRRR